jgi:hypothetical protein
MSVGTRQLYNGTTRQVHEPSYYYVTQGHRVEKFTDQYFANQRAARLKLLNPSVPVSVDRVIAWDVIAYAGSCCGDCSRQSRSCCGGVVDCCEPVLPPIPDPPESGCNCCLT